MPLSNRSTLFWWTNGFGWSLVLMSNLLLRSVVVPDFDWGNELLHSSLFVVIGLLLTGLVRVVWKHWQVYERRVVQLLSINLLLGLLVSLIHTGLILVLLQGLFALQNRPFVWSLNLALSNLSIFFFIHITWIMLYTGIHYIWRVQQLRLEQLQLEKALNEARLNSLMGQLNPHFLFNALNNIRALMLEDVPKARTMLGSLSASLRYALQANQLPLVPLSVELDMVEHFMGLARIQLEERLDFQASIAEGVEAVPVPPMMLILLVENAIKHGISPLVEGGRLGMDISRQGAALHVQVTNDYQPQQTATASTHIGLHNLRERLRLLYQDRASLDYHSKEQQVTVTIRLPLESVSV